MTSCVYFSATRTTQKTVREMARAIQTDFKEYDVTLGAGEEKIFNSEDLVIFGAPVYSGRIYKGAMERFEKFKGKRTPCILVAVYGNRAFEDALVELYDFAKRQGFIPVGAAAVIGQHTYGSIQVGRPELQDLKQDNEFAKKLYEALKKGELTEVKVPGNRPYREGGQGGGFRPVTKENCSLCGLCAAQCPEQAISFEDPTQLDSSRCIACFRCIRECPVGAKVMDSEKYEAFIKDFNVKLATRKENAYFITLKDERH